MTSERQVQRVGLAYHHGNSVLQLQPGDAIATTAANRALLATLVAALSFVVKAAAIACLGWPLLSFAQSETIVYRPNASELRAIDGPTAMRNLKELLTAESNKWSAILARRGDMARQFEVSEGGFRFKSGSRYKGQTSFEFAKLEGIEIVEKPYAFHKEQHVRLSGDAFLKCEVSDVERELCNRRLADALFILSRLARGEGNDEEFETVAAQYRAAGQRPPLPEEARRFRVQAEFAVEQKRFDDAARFYREALKVTPWWPEGRFNLALVLAESKRYSQAIVEMKRFLALEPEHPQARAAQDQIYRWESVSGPSAAPAAGMQKRQESCRTVFGCAQQ